MANTSFEYQADTTDGQTLCFMVEACGSVVRGDEVVNFEWQIEEAYNSDGEPLMSDAVKAVLTNEDVLKIEASACERMVERYNDLVSAY